MRLFGKCDDLLFEKKIIAIKASDKLGRALFLEVGKLNLMVQVAIVRTYAGVSSAKMYYDAPIQSEYLDCKIFYWVDTKSGTFCEVKESSADRFRRTTSGIKVLKVLNLRRNRGDTLWRAITGHVGVASKQEICANGADKIEIRILH